MPPDAVRKLDVCVGNPSVSIGWKRTAKEVIPHQAHREDTVEMGHSLPKALAYTPDNFGLKCRPATSTTTTFATNILHPDNGWLLAGCFQGASQLRAPHTPSERHRPLPLPVYTGCMRAYINAISLPGTIDRFAGNAQCMRANTCPQILPSRRTPGITPPGASSSQRRAQIVSSPCSYDQLCSASGRRNERGLRP